MSFNRFVAVAVKFQLFSIEKQKEFAEKTEVDLLITAYIKYYYRFYLTISIDSVDYFK